MELHQILRLKCIKHHTSMCIIWLIGFILCMLYLLNHCHVEMRPKRKNLRKPMNDLGMMWNENYETLKDIGEYLNVQNFFELENLKR